MSMSGMSLHYTAQIQSLWLSRQKWVWLPWHVLNGQHTFLPISFNIFLPPVALFSISLNVKKIIIIIICLFRQKNLSDYKLHLNDWQSWRQSLCYDPYMNVKSDIIGHIEGANIFNLYCTLYQTYNIWFISCHQSVCQDCAGCSIMWTFR